MTLRRAPPERHGDAAPARRVPDLDPRALRPGRRRGEPPPGRDLRRRRGLPARSSTARGSTATSARTGRPRRALVEPSHGALPFQVAIVLLARVGGRGRVRRPTGSSTRSTRPSSALGISKAFTGLVIVAIAGNAVENVVARPARLEGPERPRDLRREELGRADRLLPLAGAGHRLAVLRRAAHVRGRAGLPRRARAARRSRSGRSPATAEAVLFEGLALVSLYVVLATLVWFE